MYFHFVAGRGICAPANCAPPSGEMKPLDESLSVSISLIVGNEAGVEYVVMVLT